MLDLRGALGAFSDFWLVAQYPAGLADALTPVRFDRPALRVVPEGVDCADERRLLEETATR